MSKIREDSLQFLENELKARGFKDLTPVHGDVIYTIATNEGLDMKTLAELTWRDKTTVTNIIKKLAATGYVKKTPSPTDGRSVELYLTNKAKKLIKPLFRISQAYNKKLLKGFSKRQIQNLESELKKLHHNLQ